MLRRILSQIIRGFRYTFAGGLLRDFKALFAVRKNNDVEVLFFCQYPFHEGWIRSTVAELDASDVKYLVVVDNSARLLETLPAEKQLLCSHRMFSRLSCRLFVTPVSGMTRQQMPKAETTVHMPHSLASLHMIYPDGAFDGYDFIFACGDHHVAEIAEIRRLRPSFVGRAIEVGYGKTDWLVEKPSHENFSDRPLVVVAPSWGTENLLNSLGTALISELLSLGVQVVCRPHPSFFVFGNSILVEFEKCFGGNKDFRIERADTSDTRFLSADVLISDYSGIALEFAFVTCRSVVFVDLPAKVLNKNWRELGLKPLELDLRDELGRVVVPDAAKIAEVVSDLLSQSVSDTNKIASLRRNYNYNFRKCGMTAANAIQSLLKKKDDTANI